MDGFLKSRQHMIDIAKRQVEDENPRRKRRKVSGDPQNGYADSAPSRQTRSSVRRGGGNTTSLPPSQEIIAIDSDGDGEEEYMPSPKRQRTAHPPTEPDDGLVACPMCTQRMKEEFVFSHLDRCDGSSKTTQTPPPSLPKRLQPERQPPSPAKHLPHLNYSLLKDNALKKKLQELGIPTWGTRQLLTRRHRQWVDISNANSDSPRPKSTAQLLKELDTWERTQGGLAPGQGQTGPTGVMRKDFNGEEWTGRHKNQFDDLITQARAKRQKIATTEDKEDRLGLDGTNDESKVKNNEELPVATAGDAMEGILQQPPVQDYIEPNPTPTVHSSLKISTPPKCSPPPVTKMEFSPVASMLHTTAQDVRRRSSVIGAPPVLLNSVSVVENTLSGEEISHTAVQMPVSSQGQERRQSVSLPEKMGLHVEGTRTMPMFQVPESSIGKAESLSAGVGGD